MSLFKMQKSEIEKKLKEFNKKRNYRESREFKKLSTDYYYLIKKIDAYQSNEMSDLAKEGIKYLDNPFLSPSQKLNYIKARREHLKEQLKKCTLDVFNIFF